MARLAFASGAGERPVTSIDRQSQQHLAGVRRVLQSTTACPSCVPDGWSRTVEKAWKDHYLADEKARLRAFALKHREFMPASSIQLERFGSGRILSSNKAVLRSSLLDFWEPTISCARESRIPLAVGDGPKWVCDPRAYPAPCTVLSVGSNYDASFEEGLNEAASCVSYIVDPTLTDLPRLEHFQKRIRRFAHLNMSVGLGPEGHVLPGNIKVPLVGLATLLRDRYGAPPTRLSVLKIDIESFELDVLPELWRLCASGDLVLDQLNVEMHLVNVNRTEPLRVRDVFSVFAGALQCGLALHHKEVNTFTADFNYINKLAEFSWMSLAHAKRSAMALTTMHSNGHVSKPL